MRQLLCKEFRLAMHPTAILFLLLSAMVLIPNYPYHVIFFYTTLGIFFISLTGRENCDIRYTLALPVPKKAIVRARTATIVLLELAQVLMVIPFLFLRSALGLPGNLVGLDANIALLGSGLIMLGLFNIVFLPKHYRAPDHVGVPFLLGCIASSVYMLIVEACVHIVPFVRDVLDTADPIGLPAKCIILAVGVLLYVLLTFAACRLAARHFDKIDL